jgi:hypothetical protein
MENLEQFFKGKDLGYARDPRRMAYAKLQKNTQGMDREQLEAFIKANLMIPHSQYKMALGNLIQFLNKQDQMGSLNEVKRFKKIAGLLKENWHPDDPSAVDMDDIEDEDPEDFDDVSENETDNNKEYYETTQDFLDVVFDILNDEMRVGYFSAKGLDKADAYLTKHGEKLAKSGKSAYDVADALMAKFNYTVSEDADYESESGDTNAMGDTDAIDINEDEPEKKSTLDKKEKIGERLQSAVKDYLESIGLREISKEEKPKFQKGLGRTQTTVPDTFVNKVGVNFHYMTSDDDPRREDPRHDDQEVTYGLRIYKPNEKFNISTLRGFIQQAKREAKSEGFRFFDTVRRSNQDILVGVIIR